MISTAPSVVEGRTRIRREPHKGIGFGTPGVEVSMPIAPDTVICGTRTPAPEIIPILDRSEDAQEFNARTWLPSTRFVYGCSESDLAAAHDAIGEGLARTQPPTFSAHVGPAEWQTYAKNAPLRPGRGPAGPGSKG